MNLWERYKDSKSDCCNSPIKKHHGAWCKCGKCGRVRQYKDLIAVIDNSCLTCKYAQGKKSEYTGWIRCDWWEKIFASNHWCKYHN